MKINNMPFCWSVLFHFVNDISSIIVDVYLCAFGKHRNKKYFVILTGKPRHRKSKQTNVTCSRCLHVTIRIHRKRK